MSSHSSTVMIAKSAEEKRSPSPPGSTCPASFSSLPPEILEQIFLIMSHNDRLRLLLVGVYGLHLSLTLNMNSVQTCSAIRDVYINSATLQYDFTLQTTAYLDVAYRPSPSSLPQPSTSSSSRIAGADVQSPHTGKLRPTIPSVSLAPYAANPSRKTGLAVPLSAQEKNKLLYDRERRWETLDADHVRTFKINGPAGVYELQEGIFLMCDEYSDSDDGRVSQRSAGSRHEIAALPCSDTMNSLSRSASYLCRRQTTRT